MPVPSFLKGFAPFTKMHNPDKLWDEADERKRLTWMFAAETEGAFRGQSDVELSDLDVAASAFASRFMVHSGVQTSGKKPSSDIYTLDAMEQTSDAMHRLGIRQVDRADVERLMLSNLQGVVAGMPARRTASTFQQMPTMAGSAEEQMWQTLNSGAMPNVSVRKAPAGGEGRVVEIVSPSGHNIYKHIEPVGGGYRIDNRLVHGTFEGGAGGGYTSPEQVVLDMMRLTEFRVRQRIEKSPYEEIKRTASQAIRRGGQLPLGSGMEREVPGLEAFPGMPESWAQRLPPHLQTRLALGGQVITEEGKQRDPGLWKREFGYGEDQSHLGLMLSRGGETDPGEIRRTGRFGAFPTAAFYATPEMMGGERGAQGGREPFFLHGFGYGKGAAPPVPQTGGMMRGGDPQATAKTAKRAQMSAQEQFFMEGRDIVKAPFRYSQIKLPSGEMYQPPRERGQLVNAAIMMTGLMPEGMGIASSKARLPATYEQRVVHTAMPVNERGESSPAVPGEIGTTTGRYGTMTLGHTSEGQPIRWRGGDWMNAEIAGSEAYTMGGTETSPGIQMLKTTIRQRIRTGGQTKMMSGGLKALETLGRLPQELEAQGVEFMYPAWKNLMGASHNLLWAAQAAEDPGYFEKLMTKHGVSYDMVEGQPTVDWYAESDRHAKGVIGAAQEYAGKYTKQQEVTWKIHESKLPAYQMQVDPNDPAKLMATEEHLEDLLLGSDYDSASGVWSTKIKRDMYVGPWIRQARREYQGEKPFTSFEELQQISRISHYAGVSKGSEAFAMNLREGSAQMTLSGARPQYETMLQAWESQQHVGRLPKPSQLPKIDPGTRAYEKVWSEVSSAWEAKLADPKTVSMENYWEDPQWFDILEKTVGKRMLGVPLGEGKVGYLPPPSAVGSFPAKSEFGEDQGAMLRYYMQVAKDLPMVASGDMSIDEAKEADLPKKWGNFKTSWGNLIKAPEYQRQLIGARVSRGFEGVYASSAALPPRAAVYGKEALAELAGFKPGEGLDTQKFKDFETFVEDQARAENPLLALVGRRPISDPKGQWGMAIAEVWTETLAKDRKVDIGKDDLGRSAIISPELGAVGRGDFDADRFISMLLHSDMKYTPGIKRTRVGVASPLVNQNIDALYRVSPDPGKVGTSEKVRRGTTHAMGKASVGKFVSGTEPKIVDESISGRWDIKTPKWAREIGGGRGVAGQDMLGKINERLARLTGRQVTGDLAFKEGIFANELGKWTEEQKKPSPFARGGKPSGQSMRGKDEANMWWGLLAEASGPEVQQSYINELVSKQSGMTIPYNIGRALEMTGAHEGARMSFTAMAYQFGIDRMLELQPKMDAVGDRPLKDAPHIEGLKTIMEMYSSYKPGSGQKGPGSGSGMYRKLHPYEEGTEWRESGSTKKFGPHWEQMAKTPDQFVSKMIQAVTNLGKGPSETGEGLIPEDAARLLGATEGSELQEVVDAMAGNNTLRIKEILGGQAQKGQAWNVLQRPGLPRAIAARRMGRYAGEQEREPWEWWGAGPEGSLEELERLGKSIVGTTKFLSRSQKGIPDILGKLWDMPYASEYDWLPQDILSRVNAPQEDPVKFYGSFATGGSASYFNYRHQASGVVKKIREELGMASDEPLESVHEIGEGYLFKRGTETVLSEEASAALRWSMENPGKGIGASRAKILDQAIADLKAQPERQVSGGPATSEQSAMGSPPSAAPSVAASGPPAATTSAGAGKPPEIPSVRASQIGASRETILQNKLQELGALPGATVEGLVGSGGHLGAKVLGKIEGDPGLEFEKAGRRLIHVPGRGDVWIEGTADVVRQQAGKGYDYKTGQPHPLSEQQQRFQGAAYGYIHGLESTQFVHMPQTEEAEKVLKSARAYVAGKGFTSEEQMAADPAAVKHMLAVGRQLRKGTPETPMEPVSEKELGVQVGRYMDVEEEMALEAQSLAQYRQTNVPGVGWMGQRRADVAGMRARRAEADPMTHRMGLLLDRLGIGVSGEEGGSGRPRWTRGTAPDADLPEVYERAASAAMAGLPTEESYEHIAELGIGHAGKERAGQLRGIGSAVQTLLKGGMITKGEASTVLGKITTQREYLRGEPMADVKMEPRMEQFEKELRRYSTGGAAPTMFHGEMGFKELETRGKDLAQAFKNLTPIVDDATATTDEMKSIMTQLGTRDFPNMRTQVNNLTSTMKLAEVDFEQRKEAATAIGQRYSTRLGDADVGRRVSAMERRSQAGRALTGGMQVQLGGLSSAVAIAQQAGMGVPADLPGRLQGITAEQRKIGEEAQADAFGRQMRGRFLEGRGRDVFEQLTGASGYQDLPGGLGGPTNIYRNVFSGWELMRLQRQWSLTGEPTFQRYIPAAAQAQQQAWRVAQATGGFQGGLPPGAAGGLMASQAARARTDVQAGIAGYQAWGQTPFMGAQGGIKELQAVLGPAAGVALGAGFGVEMAALGLGAGMAGASAAALGAAVPIAGVLGAGALGQWEISRWQGTSQNQITRYRESQRKIQAYERLGMSRQEAETLYTPAEPVERFTAKGLQKVIEGIAGFLGSPKTDFSDVGTGIKVPDISFLPTAAEKRAVLAAGEAVSRKPFGELDVGQRTANIQALGMELGEKAGTMWSGIDPAQFAQVYGQAGMYQDLNQYSYSDMLRWGGTSLMRRIAATGQAPEQMEDLLRPLRQDRAFTAGVYMDITAMPARAQGRTISALGQYAPRMQYGISAEEIRKRTVPTYRETPGGDRILSTPDWQPKYGQEAISQEMAYGVVPMAMQMMGQPTSTQTAYAWQQRLEDMDPADVERFGLGIPAAAQRVQMQGMSPEAGYTIARQYQQALKRPGVGTQAVNLAAQLQLGQGQVWGALGGLPGLGGQFEAPIADALLGGQGQLDPQEYGQMAGLMGFGRGQMGYSMMAGAFGIGRQLRGVFGQTPLGMPFGEALMDEQGYSVGQLEKRGLQRQFQLAGQQRQFQQFEQQRAQYGLAVRQTAATQEFQLAGIDINRAQALAMQAFTVELRGLADNMKDFNRDFQELSWDFAIEGRTLGRQQQAEKMGLQRAGQVADVEYQRQMMGFQRGQQLTQQGWQQEDVAWGRGMAGFQFEYQMDETERAMRLAGGREREQLWRRREYMEEMYSRQESRRGTEEGRLQEQMGWQDQLFSMQTTHFEAQVARQDQQYQMTVDHLSAQYSLEDEQFQAQMTHTRELWVLQDAMTAKQREAEDARFEFQISEMDRTKQYYQETVFPFQNERLALQEQALTNAETYYNETVLPYQEEMYNNQVRIELAHANYIEWQMKIYAEGGDLWTAVEELVQHWLKQFYGKLDAYDVPDQLPGGQLIPDPKSLPGAQPPVAPKPPTIGDVLPLLIAALPPGEPVDVNLVIDEKTKVNAHIEVVGDERIQTVDQMTGWGGIYAK